MDTGGLHAVDNTNALFLNNRSSGATSGPGGAGSVVAAILQGNRPILLEVQVSKGSGKV